MRRSQPCRRFYSAQGWSRPPGLLFGFELFEEFGRIFVEVLAAGFAAELDFLILVVEHDGLAHLAKLVSGDDAGVESVGLHLGFGRCGRRLGGFRLRFGNGAASSIDCGGQNDDCRCQNKGVKFHIIFRGNAPGR